MPNYAAFRSLEWYRELEKKRDAYKAKLIAKGMKPRSSKMLELMSRKFHGV